MKIAAFNLSGQGSFAQDAPAIAEAVKSSGADIVLLPGTSRVRRAVGAAAMRAGAEVDTNVVDLSIDGEAVTAHRWLYRRAPALQVLLQFRSPQKDSYPSRYDISAAGHVPAGADWIPSALRELREELGVTAFPSDLLPLGRRAIHTRTAFRGVPHDNLQVSAVYALHCPRPLSDFTPQPSEVDHLRWMPLADVFSSLDSPSFPHCLSPDELRRLRALP